MESKVKSAFILFLYFSYFININTTIIAEGYHFFDIFYYRDMYKNFVKQQKNNKCSINDGPNCIFLESKSKDLISKELKNIYPDSNTFLKETPENIFLKLKEKAKLISTKEKETIDEDEVFSFDSPYVMSLYLTFESYDELTRKGDVYAPETIDTQYDIGRLTLTIMGKLRLSQKNSKNFESPIPQIKDEKPKGTYAFVESKEVFIKFNSKSIISSVYIKKNSYNKDNKSFYLYGYKDGHKKVITKIQNVPSNHWLKVTGDGKRYDSIGLLRGFDYDNFIINASINQENSANLNKYAKKYSNFFNEQVNNAIQDAITQLRNEDTSVGSPGIKVLKINLNQNEIFQEQEQDENFEIPEELLNEINNNENNNNDNKKINNEKEEDKNINKGDL